MKTDLVWSIMGESAWCIRIERMWRAHDTKMAGTNSLFRKLIEIENE